jgi:hypothetical protein
METQVYVNFLLLACLGVAFLTAVWALIEVKALQRSTHQVTYIDPFGKDRAAAAGEDSADIPPLSDKERETLSKRPEAYDNLT